MKVMKLYLCSTEEEDDSDLMRCCNNYIALEPRHREIRKILFVDENELNRISNTFEGKELFKELYRLFDITDLRASPGLPKGPYYDIDKEVYGAVAKPARVSELSRIVIDVWRKELVGIKEINDDFETHKNIY